ncbi:MAG: Type 1 glutamine amidotransferase-like domain-containing protein [Thermomicrobiales bacterium]
MIYLSSYRMGINAGVLRTCGETERAGIVFNALDVFGPSRLRSWDREAGDLSQLGYESEELDLRQYSHDPEGLAKRLDSLDLVWVVGGNAFVLARAMTTSGFGTALALALGRGMIYAGYSAGACVAGPDLRGIDLMDNSNDVPEGYDANTPADTLRLVPFRIVPHWESDHPEAASAQRAVAYLERHSLDYRAIRDGEALILGDHAHGEVRS